MLTNDDFDPEMDAKRGLPPVLTRDGITITERWPVMSPTGRLLGTCTTRREWMPTAAVVALSNTRISLDMMREDDDFDPA